MLEHSRRSFTEKCKQQAVELMVSSGLALVSHQGAWSARLGAATLGGQVPAGADIDDVRPATQAMHVGGPCLKITRLRQENEALYIERGFQRTDRDCCRKLDSGRCGQPRVYIPKADVRKRPLGVPAREDKIVQSAVAEVLSAVSEADFLGSRPSGNPLMAGL
ncbi:hypothetical protein ACVWWI_006654 [Bradyrhizobium sp. USDA 3686]|uniref:hypothetical protein n=1 Tax=Bradyrhizobium canariense TaxID=255045 RepID=UPI001958C09E|nr:hypothetical protein [Bradyrhizobium canariense]MBM7487791.1 hypothetical protein [Bradyrhizobium canariense]